MSSLAESQSLLIRRLEWDTQHFGCDVAEIVAAELSDDQLCEALSAARADGVRLVYWSTHADRVLDPDLLSRFEGLPVNHRVRFLLPMNNAQPFRDPSRVDRYLVRDIPRGVVPRALLDLAIVAGGHSRFHIDPHIPSDKFRELYETWMTRSVRRELADAVLVAARENEPDDILGMMTVSETARAGQIGLLAVREDHRGQGVGSCLMAAAHDWFQQRGALEVSVVTQRENQAACGLYSRWGYSSAEVQRTFHFWLQTR